MTKRELIEKLAEFPDDALILRGDADWGEVVVGKVEIVTVHRRYAGFDVPECWVECWGEKFCLCQDADEPEYGTRRECVKIS